MIFDLALVGAFLAATTVVLLLVRPRQVSTPVASRRYRVVWSVDIDAASPREAVGFASEIAGQSSTATRYTVTDLWTGKTWVHDLEGDCGPGLNRTFLPGKEVGRSVESAA